MNKNAVAFLLYMNEYLYMYHCALICIITPHNIQFFFSIQHVAVWLLYSKLIILSSSSLCLVSPLLSATSLSQNKQTNNKAAERSYRAHRGRDIEIERKQETSRRRRRLQREE